MTSQLQIQILEEERKKLLQHLGNLDDQILLLKQEKEEQERAKSSKKDSKDSDAWQCACGNMLAGDRHRCGKCLRWRGGKRVKRWGNSNSIPTIQRIVSSNDEEVEVPTKRKRGRKANGESISAVSLVDEQAAASLLSLSLACTRM